MADTKVTCRISKRNIVSGTDQNRAGLRVTIEDPDVVTTAKMAENISYSCSLTPTDVLAVITSLKQQFIDNLSAGKLVSLDGIGTFLLNIGTDHPMYEGEKVKAKDITLKGITYRPSKNLMESFEGIHFSPKQDISAPIQGNEALDALRIYMADEQHGQIITTPRFATLLHCCNSTARLRIRQLCADGILQKSPYVRHCFIPGPNFRPRNAVQIVL